MGWNLAGCPHSPHLLACSLQFLRSRQYTPVRKARCFIWLYLIYIGIPQRPLTHLKCFMHRGVGLLAGWLPLPSSPSSCLLSVFCAAAGRTSAFPTSTDSAITVGIDTKKPPVVGKGTLGFSFYGISRVWVCYRGFLWHNSYCKHHLGENLGIETSPETEHALCLTWSSSTPLILQSHRLIVSIDLT